MNSVKGCLLMSDEEREDGFGVYPKCGQNYLKQMRHANICWLCSYSEDKFL
jgi:hypothetical protein